MADAADTVAADLEALAQVLIQHQRMDIGNCRCGWGQDPRHLGLSHAAHVVDEAVTAGAIRDAAEVKAEGAAEVRARVEAVTSFVQFDVAGYEVEWLNRAHVLEAIDDPNSRYLAAAMELARNQVRAKVEALCRQVAATGDQGVVIRTLRAALADNESEVTS